MNDFGINLNARYYSDWIDNKHYSVYFDLADDKDDLGGVLKAWLEVVYDNETESFEFMRTTENVGGDAESEDVSEQLSNETKASIQRIIKSKMQKTA